MSIRSLRLEWSAEESHRTSFFKALVNQVACKKNRVGNEQKKELRLSLRQHVGTAGLLAGHMPQLGTIALKN
ncbi:hypothetical protein DRO29_07965 [Candidatus Bathyarchaeota archaeon]|nr:MAG: hypothetical protein DRO29_07965 [Candidatus Bathyarchaeota archaeon]